MGKEWKHNVDGDLVNDDWEYTVDGDYQPKGVKYSIDGDLTLNGRVITIDEINSHRKSRKIVNLIGCKKVENSSCFLFFMRYNLSHVGAIRFRNCSLKNLNIYAGVAELD